jgi:hypothetical protein
MGERLENLEKSWLEGQESFKYKVRVTRGNSPPPPDNADGPPSVTAADAWSAHQQQQLMYGQVQPMAPQIDGQATQMHQHGQQQPSIRAFQQNMYAPYNVHQQHSQLQQEFLQQARAKEAVPEGWGPPQPHMRQQEETETYSFSMEAHRQDARCAGDARPPPASLADTLPPTTLPTINKERTALDIVKKQELDTAFTFAADTNKDKDLAGKGMLTSFDNIYSATSADVLAVTSRLSTELNDFVNGLESLRDIFANSKLDDLQQFKSPPPHQFDAYHSVVPWGGGQPSAYTADPSLREPITSPPPEYNNGQAPGVCVCVCVRARCLLLHLLTCYFFFFNYMQQLRHNTTLSRSCRTRCEERLFRRSASCRVRSLLALLVQKYSF